MGRQGNFSFRVGRPVFWVKSTSLAPLTFPTGLRWCHWPQPALFLATMQTFMGYPRSFVSGIGAACSVNCMAVPSKLDLHVTLNNWSIGQGAASNLEVLLMRHLEHPDYLHFAQETALPTKVFMRS